MGQLLVRGLDDRVIRLLKDQAAQHGRSVEAEHRAILEASVGTAAETFAERAARLRARTPSSTLDSADQIRFDRDHNYDYDPDEL